MTRDALSARLGAAAEADRVLAATLAEAHHVSVEALRQLDAIEAEIESAVAQQEMLALDTPEGARQFHRFLTAKQRDIIDIVTGAYDNAAAKTIDLQGLSGQYGATADL